MTEWPRLTEPALVERLALEDEELRAVLREFTGAMQLPPFDEAFYRAAVAYPWSRPQGSFLLRGVEVTPLDDGASVAAALAALTTTDAADDPRFPLLAIGSNGAPSTLVRKFAHRPEAEQRLVVQSGYLHGFDVGPVAGITLYGSLPATPFPSPGTAVRASVLWVTAAQLTALTWTEVSYSLGRLEPVQFEPDHRAPGSPEVDDALLYVSRWGTLTIDGAPVALEAVEARGRTAPAYAQEALIGHAAARVIGHSASARDLVEQLTRDPLATLGAAAEILGADALAFDAPTWTPYPTA